MPVIRAPDQGQRRPDTAVAKPAGPEFLFRACSWHSGAAFGQRRGWAMSVSSRVIAFSLISMAISLGDLAVAAPRPPAPPAHAWWKPRTNLAPTVAHVHRIFTGG